MKWVLLLLPISGCSSYAAGATDPTERGLLSVSAAIVIAAIIRAIFNK